LRPAALDVFRMPDTSLRGSANGGRLRKRTREKRAPATGTRRSSHRGSLSTKRFSTAISPLLSADEQPVARVLEHLRRHIELLLDGLPGGRICHVQAERPEARSCQRQPIHRMRPLISALGSIRRGCATRSCSPDASILIDSGPRSPTCGWHPRPAPVPLSGCCDRLGQRRSGCCWRTIPPARPANPPTSAALWPRFPWAGAACIRPGHDDSDSG